MTSQWKDLLLRKALDDTGTVPYPGGSWTNSPDIIPNGAAVVADPQATFGTKDAYKADQGQPTVRSQRNYFYVRAKNLAAAAETGDVFLYYCPQNLFLFPSLWKDNQLGTSSGKTSIPVTAPNAGDVAVTPEAFTYIPDSDMHACLISRVATKANPSPLPNDGDFADIDGLAKFIVSHPGYAWRNVVLVDKGVPTFNHTFWIDTTSIAPDKTQMFLIGISFNNLSPGSSLAFSAGTPIPSGPDKGKKIELVQTEVPQADGSLGTAYLSIPGGYRTMVSYSYWAKPPILANWKVQFYAIQIVGPKSALIKAALPIHQLAHPGLDHDHPLLRLGGDQLYGIRVGDVSTIGR